MNCVIDKNGALPRALCLLLALFLSSDEPRTCSKLMRRRRQLVKRLRHCGDAAN